MALPPAVAKMSNGDNRPVTPVAIVFGSSGGGGSGGDASAENQEEQIDLLTQIRGFVDGLETLATTLNGYVDGLEGLVGSTNTLLTTQNGFVDGIEGLITTLNGYVDGLEGLLAKGQANKAGSLSVTVATDQGEVGKVYTGYFNVNGSPMTRPANVTPYSANDSISNDGTAASVTANVVALSDTNDVAIELAEILLASTDTGPGTAGVQIRLHLFNSDPTASSGVVAGDNATWSNKQAGWLGSFTGTMRGFSDGSRGVLVPDEGSLRIGNPSTAGKNFWWQLQVLGAFTPSANSTTFTPRFKGFQGRAA